MLCVYKPLFTLSGNLKDNWLGVRVGLRLGLCLSISLLGCIIFLSFPSSLFSWSFPKPSIGYLISCPLGMQSDRWSQPTILLFPLAYKTLQPSFLFLIFSFSSCTPQLLCSSVFFSSSYTCFKCKERQNKKVILQFFFVKL